MGLERRDPEQLLESIRQEEKTKTQGRLKIFFGYAAGVGKTYAMLEAAHQAAAAGTDVVLGYIEPHARPDTATLAVGLEQVPLRHGIYRDIELTELDVDAVLARKPQLVLVDELAHTNAPFCRHQKRAQDVEELLRAGIDVWTTVNVQHIESLNDIVAAITGTVVRERINDELFDGASQVELVDIDPEALLERLRAGKIYRDPGAALHNFFVQENLRSLREIALRRMTERMSRRSEEKSEVPIEEHVLIGLSSSPSNPRVIRAAARLAAAFGGKFTAIFVEMPDFSSMSADNRRRLDANTKLARSLGANIVTVYGEDVGWQIAEYVKKARISKVVLGRSMTRRRLFSPRPNFGTRLQELAPNLDIYIIPDHTAGTYVPAMRRLRPHPVLRHGLRDLGLVALSLAVSTVLGMGIDSSGYSGTDIIMVYLLGVLGPAFFVENWIYSLLDALLSVLVFNFMFVAPRYTFSAYAPGATLTFFVMFLVSLTVVLLTRQVRRQARQSAEKAYRTEVMLETVSRLQNTEECAEIFRVMGQQLQKLLDRTVLFYDGRNMQDPHLFPRRGQQTDMSAYLAGNERALAAWAYKNNKHAGAMTNTLPAAHCLYLTVRGRERVMGVIAIALDGERLSSFEYNMVVALIDSSALALEKDHQRRQRRAMEVAAKQDQLRNNLLRAISHDLRTPLTTIAGNAELLQSAERLDGEQRKRLSSDIAADAHWLIDIVENLLSVTRLDNGNLQLNMQPEVLGDVIQEAVTHARPRLGSHKLRVSLEDDLLLVRADVRLLLQVFMNLLDNALKYTPEETEITISATKNNGFAVIEVADNGGGIPAADRAHVFDLFYTSGHKAADGRRGMGIGLALCRSIIVAHGGSISVRDNRPHGTIFRFTLCLEEAEVHG